MTRRATEQFQLDQKLVDVAVSRSYDVFKDALFDRLDPLDSKSLNLKAAVCSVYLQGFRDCRVLMETRNQEFEQGSGI